MPGGFGGCSTLGRGEWLSANKVCSQWQPQGRLEDLTNLLWATHLSWKDLEVRKEETLRKNAGRCDKRSAKRKPFTKSLSSAPGGPLYAYIYIYIYIYVYMRSVSEGTP